MYSFYIFSFLFLFSLIIFQISNKSYVPIIVNKLYLYYFPQICITSCLNYCAIIFIVYILPCHFYYCIIIFSFDYVWITAIPLHVISIELTHRNATLEKLLRALRAAFDLAESNGIGCSLRLVSSEPVYIKRCIHRRCIHRIRSSITRRIRRESRFVGEHTSFAKCGRKSKIGRTEHVAFDVRTYVRTYNRTRSFARSFTRVHVNSTHVLRGDSWLFFVGFCPAAPFKFVACFIRFRLSLSYPWQALCQTSAFPKTHVDAVRASEQIDYLRIFVENDTHVAGSRCIVFFSLSFFFLFLWTREWWCEE